MGFEALLGNDRLKENLIASLGKGRINHFYLISGPEGSGRHTLAKLLAAAILCREPGRPCGKCPSCKKILSGSHPDFITVDDPEKKTVPVELIRQARTDMFIRPNESEYKLYLFPRAQDMGVPGQNALLKILEEPPPYGVFMLLTTNPESLLPTVRSRCVELSMSPLSREQLLPVLQREFPQLEQTALLAAAERSGGYLGQAKILLSQPEDSPRTQAFAQALARRSELALAQVLAPMEKSKRDVLIEELQAWKTLLHQALLHRSGIRAMSAAAAELARQRSTKELMGAIGHLDKTIEYAQGNVSPAAICGYLTWHLR